MTPSLGRTHVYVVVPAHNRREVTLAGLACLDAQDYPHRTVVLVDDGSIDGTAAAVRERFPDMKVLEGDGNLWWTGATNLGVEWVLRRAEADAFIIFLNDDVIIAPDFLTRIVEAGLEKPGCLVGSVALSSDTGEVVDGGVRINWMTAKHHFIGRALDLETLANNMGEEWEVDVLPGRGTLIPVKIFDAVGLPDADGLPHYGGDYEFSRRASRAGFPLLLRSDIALRSRTEGSGLNNAVHPLGWTDLVRSFFTRRSPNCLATRAKMAVRMAPPILFPTFLILDLTRVVVSVVRRQLSTPRGVLPDLKAPGAADDARADR